MLISLALAVACAPDILPKAESTTGPDQTSSDTDRSIDSDEGAIDTADTAPASGYQTEFEVQVDLTADDAWEMWIDAQAAGAEQGWSYASIQQTAVSLQQDGPHVVAVHAYDTHGVISGFLAQVSVEGVPRGHTGDGTWKMTTTTPPTDWADPRFDASTWTTPIPCTSSDLATWNNNPAALLGTGAKWVWSGNCHSLGNVWLRYEFTLP
jgi:hypothetical protein